MQDEFPASTNEALPEPPSRNTRRWLVFAFLLLVAVALLAIYWPRPQAKAAPKSLAMGWRPVISFSGHGSTQTESFEITTGQWRIKWSTRAEAGAPQASPAQARSTQSESNQVSSANKFRLVVHSLVSGRFVSVAADHQGPGSGIAYLAEEPRPFFLVVRSSGLDWKLQVEEGVVGEEENSH